MDWIERLLHVSPDGGNGVTELLYLVDGLLLAAIVIASLIRRRHRQSRSTGSDKR